MHHRVSQRFCWDSDRGELVSFRNARGPGGRRLRSTRGRLPLRAALSRIVPEVSRSRPTPADHGMPRLGTAPGARLPDSGVPLAPVHVSDCRVPMAFVESCATLPKRSTWGRGPRRGRRGFWITLPPQQRHHPDRRRYRRSSRRSLTSQRQRLYIFARHFTSRSQTKRQTLTSTHINSHQALDKSRTYASLATQASRRIDN